MKKLLVVIPFIAFSTFASLTSTGYEARHVELLKTALDNSCGSFRNLEVLSKDEEIIRVDQGIRDVKYTTVLTGEQRMDQNIFDTYEIVIKSEYSDMYDHVNKDWGVYSVTSVNCVMK
ncbi:MAG: hypothetical protein L6Q33_01870 [Bacteriovoracaceae bacterium]|nr:hypothetical protein [Bacteriovoracaceae bacterium]